MAMHGCVKRKFFKLDETKVTFYSKYYLVSGIILYISGIFDWYDGKELLYLVDFVLSFFFLYLYLSEVSNDITFFIGISYKNKSKFLNINYAALFIGFIFLFLHKYFQNDWLEDAYSYMFIIIGGFFWISGLQKMIDSFMTNNSLFFFTQGD